MRVGKLTLAALEATLTLFLDESLALEQVPTLAMLRRSRTEIAEQARRIAEALQQRTGRAEVSSQAGFSQMGSGSLPTQNLPTRVVSIRPKTLQPGELARRLRRHAPPVFTRVKKGRVLVDPRTLMEGEEAIVVEAVVEALETEG